MQHRFRIACSLLGAAFAALLCGGCVMPPQKGTAAHVARSDGTISRGVLSAMDAQPGDAGPQEIIAVNVPIGPHFQLKAGLVWDGTAWTPIVIGPQAPAAVPYAAPAPATVRQRIRVPKTVYEEVEVEVPAVTIPLPAAPPPPQDPCKPEPPVSSGSDSGTSANEVAVGST